MDVHNEALLSLLRRCSMYPADMDLRTLMASMLGQMRISFYGGVSTVPVRHTDLNATGTLPQQQPVVVALVDTQQIRTATVCFDGGAPAITKGESFPVPGGDYPAPVEDLLFAVGELCAPLLAHCDRLALCLNFPLAATENGDDAIAALPPGFRLTDWEQAPLAQLLLKELSSRGLSGKQVVVLPEIAATLLDGFAWGKSGRQLGLYWGDQGVNCAFVAPKSAVVRLKSGENTLQIFDTGLGGFDGFPFGTLDLTLDRDSQYPGRGLLDKLVSTAMLGNLCRLTTVKAVEEDLLSFMCGREFLSLRKLDLDTPLRFLADPDGDNLLANFCRHAPGDRDIALTVSDAVLTRGARLVAASLGATLSLVGAGRDPENPACVSVSGEAFAAPLLREKLTQLLTDDLPALGLHAKLHAAAPDRFAGAAAAFLLSPHRQKS